MDVEDRLVFGECLARTVEVAEDGVGPDEEGRAERDEEGRAESGKRSTGSGEGSPEQQVKESMERDEESTERDEASADKPVPLAIVRIVSVKPMNFKYARK